MKTRTLLGMMILAIAFLSLSCMSAEDYQAAKELQLKETEVSLKATGQAADISARGTEVAGQVTTRATEVASRERVDRSEEAENYAEADFWTQAARFVTEAIAPLRASTLVLVVVGLLGVVLIFEAIR